MRPVCPRCALPLPACLCRWITPTHNRVGLLVLQHPQEAQHAKGSVRLLQLSLANSRCVVGEHVPPAVLAGLLQPAVACGQIALSQSRRHSRTAIPRAASNGVARAIQSCNGPRVM